MSVTILGIESSCDDTSAAVIRDGILLSNVIASQSVHEEYGGVVPELASRAHQQNIVPVVDTALRRAGIQASDLSAIAFTRGPGLLGSLLVGTSFAKGMSLGLRIPIVDVNHLHGHVLSHFIRRQPDDTVPEYPFLCLLISGGNSQIILVKNYNDMEILGRTIDDAAGEAFDKCAKVMGLPYPGGPHIDRHAANGNPDRFKFAKPHIPGYDYSFSGLKTSFLYTLRDNVAVDPEFITKNIDDLAASLQRTIIEILINKLDKAVKATGVRTVAIGGGVSANSGIRVAIADYCQRRGLKAFIPERVFTTDNAAMVAIAGYFKYLDKQFCAYDAAPSHASACKPTYLYDFRYYSAYNVEKYIGACLDSVLAQEGVDMEIIVVDDESTDSTRDIIRRYARQHSCIKALDCRHGGPSAARNTALRHSTGEWLAMVDGDDMLAPGALKKMLHAANAADGIDIVVGRYRSFTDKLKVVTPVDKDDVLFFSGKDATEIMLYQKHYYDRINPSAWGKLYRKNVWLNVTFTEGLIYEDLQLIPRIFLDTLRIAVIDDIVYGYRRNDNSLLHTFSKSRLDALKATARLCDCFAGDKKLCKAARSRHFSAAFNLWLLIEVNNPSMAAEMAECRRVVRQLAVSQLFGRKVRLKNRIGALLQYFPFIFKSTYLCKKLLAK